MNSLVATRIVQRHARWLWALTVCVATEWPCVSTAADGEASWTSRTGATDFATSAGPMRATYTNSPEGGISIAIQKLGAAGESGKTANYCVFRDSIYRVDRFAISPSGHALCLLLSRRILGDSGRSFGIALFTMRDGEIASLFAGHKRRSPDRDEVDYVDMLGLLQSRVRESPNSKERARYALGATKCDSAAVSFQSATELRVVGFQDRTRVFTVNMRIDERAETIDIKDVLLDDPE